MYIYIYIHVIWRTSWTTRQSRVGHHVFCKKKTLKVDRLTKILGFFLPSCQIFDQFVDIRPWYSQGIMDYLHFPEMAEMSGMAPWRSEYGFFLPKHRGGLGYPKWVGNSMLATSRDKWSIGRPQQGQWTMKINILPFTVSLFAVSMVSRDSYWIEDVVECLGKRGDTSN